MKTEKEILEAVRVLQEANPHDEGIQNWVRNYFPELKESDDEKIRKKICKLLWDNAPYEEAQEYITWLEKQSENKSINNLTQQEAMDIAVAKCFEQGEQKPVIEMKTPEESLGIDSNTYNKIVDECIYGEQKPADKSEPTDYNSIDPYFGKPIDKVEPKFKVGQIIKKEGFNLGFIIVKIEDGFYYNDMGDYFPFTDQENWELVERASAWSEEDETTKNNISHIIRQYDKISKRENQPCWYVGDCLLWLNSLKDRVQPKQEWSEEDRETIDYLIDYLESELDSSYTKEDKEAFTKEIKLLKSIRPQNRWKPSEEQMTALKHASNDCSIAFADMKILATLYEQIKALYCYE